MKEFSVKISPPSKDNKGYSEESERDFWKRACQETMNFIKENSPEKILYYGKKIDPSDPTQKT